MLVHRFRKFAQGALCLGAVLLCAQVSWGNTAEEQSEPSGFAVSANGFPTYTYPVAVPPGIAGLVPKLSIYYAGNPTPGGALGTGWALQGLSTITRCQSVYALDGRRTDYHYIPTDKLCLDGQRLIQTDANGNIIGGSAPVQTNDALGVGSGVREYRTEIDNFSRIRAYGSAGGTDANGPAYFKVWTKDGRIMEYGTSPNGNNASIGAQGRSAVATWALSRISDLHGNYIDFKYEVRDTAWGTGPSTGPLPGREWNLIEVQYTGNGSQAPTKKVVFNYRDRPDYALSTGLLQDRVEAYHDGSKTVSIRLLDNIKTYINSPNPTSLGPAAGAVEVGVIKLGYDNGPVTNRSRLTSITHCVGAAEASCVSPVKFSYSAGGNDAYVTASGYARSSFASHTFNIPLNVAGQVNHDLTGSFVDIYGSGSPELIVSGNPSQLYMVNSDGSTTSDSRFNLASACSLCTLSFDYDGDGLPDAAKLTYVTTNTYQLSLYHNNGNGTFSGPTVVSNITLVSTPATNGTKTQTCTGAQGSSGSGVCLTWPSSDTYYYLDVDGDGIPDIITTHMPTNDNSVMPGSYTPWSASGDLSSIEPYCLQSWGACNTHVYHGNGNGTFTEIPTNMANWSLYMTSSSSKSMTGNGLTDLVGKNFVYPMYKGATNMQSINTVWLSQGNGSFLPSWNLNVPTSGATSGCSGWDISICFDNNGSGQQSDGYISSGLMGVSPSISWSYNLNVGAYVYAASSSVGQQFFTQATNIPVSEFFQFPANPASTLPPKGSTWVTSVLGVTVIDVNGDGRDDFIRWGDDPTKNELWLSRGDGTYVKSTTFNLNGPNNQLMRSDGTATMMVGNFTGASDGQILASNTHPAIPNSTDDSGLTTTYTNVTSTSTQYGSALYIKADPSKPDLMQTITSETGLVTRLNYAPLNATSGVYQPQIGAYPKQAITQPWQVIASVTEDTGVGGNTLTTSYNYAGLKGSLVGRGILGFSEVKRQEYGPDGSLITTDTRYSQDYPYIGKVVSEAKWAGTLSLTNPSLLQYSAFGYCDQTLGSGNSNIPAANMGSGLPAMPASCVSNQPLAHPFVQNKLEQHADLNGAAMPTVATAYANNGCGDALTETETHTGTAAGLAQTATSVTTNTYQADNTAGDTWIRCKLANRVVQNTVPNNMGTITTAAGNAQYATETVGTPQTITLAASTQSVLMNLQDPGNFSQSVTLTPSGSFATPLTYTVTQLTGSTHLVTVAPGATSTFTAALSGYGQSINETYRIKATDYLGRWGSVDINVQFSVSKKPTTTAVTTNSPVTVGGTLNVSAAVSGASPTGSVSFSDSVTGAIGTPALASGSAGVSEVMTAAGTRTITASYSGDGANTNSSGSSTVTVAKATPSVAIGVSTSVTAVGWGVTFYATAYGYNPTGTISFYDGGTLLCQTAATAAGSNNCSSSFGGVGTHTVVAQYSGDGNNNAASSGGTAVTVYPPVSVSVGNGGAQIKITSGSSCSFSKAVGATAGGGTGSYTYSWSAPSITSGLSLYPSGASASVAGSLAATHGGNASVVVTATDGIGQVASASTTFTFSCEKQGN